METEKTDFITKLSGRLTVLVGTPLSLVLHTFFFIGMFLSVIIGWDVQEMLLALTTILSIEAIYLALFIQMTVNKTSESLQDVEKDIDAIWEDERKDNVYDAEVTKTLKSIQIRLNRLQKDLDVLKEKGIM